MGFADEQIAAGKEIKDNSEYGKGNDRYEVVCRWID